MAKIANLPTGDNGGDAADDALFVAYSANEGVTAVNPSGGKDVKFSTAQLRQTARSETLNNKQINAPGATKKGYFAAVQVGHKLTNILQFSTDVAVAALAAGAEADIAVAAAGAAVGDSVIATPPATPTAGLGVMAVWVSAANTVTVRVRNFSGGAISQTLSWKFLLLRTAAADV